MSGIPRAPPKSGNSASCTDTNPPAGLSVRYAHVDRITSVYQGREGCGYGIISDYLFHLSNVGFNRCVRSSVPCSAIIVSVNYRRLIGQHSLPAQPTSIVENTYFRRILTYTLPFASVCRFSSGFN